MLHGNELASMFSHPLVNQTWLTQKALKLSPSITNYSKEEVIKRNMKASRLHEIE